MSASSNKGILKYFRMKLLFKSLSESIRHIMDGVDGKNVVYYYPKNQNVIFAIIKGVVIPALNFTPNVTCSHQNFIVL